MPTTNGTRAIPATVLPTPPAFPTVTSIAAAIPNKPNFNTIAPTVIAWNTPLVGETSGGATRESTASVPAIYIAAIRTPEANTARGKVLRGLRTSALIAETNSNPVKAKAICDQKFTVSQFQTGFMFVQVIGVMAPWWLHTATPMATSISSGKYVETTPAFCNH